MPVSSSTREPSYTARLQRLEGVWWKRLLDVQRPYRWNMRRLRLGFVLDVGCGLGRNLVNLGGRDAGVGVDHNPESVAACERRGLVAFTPEAFRASEYARPGRFDTLLLAHVVEHMRFDEARALIQEYLPLVRAGGRVVLMAPEEAGFASDVTHVEFMDMAALDRLARAVGVVPERAFSFPFPRPAGRLFKYNEFVLMARKS
jgi:SAM-dependent methyltransferase